MPLNIVSWNVRNLSAEIQRNGVRGNGFSFENRVSMLLSSIERLNYDIVLLLETGPDAQRGIVDNLRKNGSYVGLCSATTGGETYTVIYKANIRIRRVGLIAPAGGPHRFRDGWLLECGYGNHTFKILTLHAPSGATSAYKTDFICSVLLKASQTLPLVPMLFAGDLNVPRRDLHLLASKITSLNKTLQQAGGPLMFSYQGPADVNNLPKGTSLRRHYNIQTGALGAPENQPFDQFYWFGPLPLAPMTSDVINPFMDSAIIRANLLDYTNVGIAVYADYVDNDNFRDRKDPLPINRMDPLYQIFDEFRALYLIFEGISREALGLLRDFFPDIPQWKKWLKKVSDFLAPLASLDDGHDYPIRHGFYIKSRFILIRILPFVRIVICLIRQQLDNGRRIDGQYPLELIRLAEYEYSISDHLPILMKLG